VHGVTLLAVLVERHSIRFEAKRRPDKLPPVKPAAYLDERRSRVNGEGADKTASCQGDRILRLPL